MDFEKFIWLCNRHDNPDIEHVPHPKNSFMSLWGQFLAAVHILWKPLI